MLLAEDANGTCHTDAVLRALSFYKEPGGDAITQWVLASNGAAYGCSAANKRRGISAGSAACLRVSMRSPCSRRSASSTWWRSGDNSTNRSDAA
jgi:hypothetical protein